MVIEAKTPFEGIAPKKKPWDAPVQCPPGYVYSYTEKHCVPSKRGQAKVDLSAEALAKEERVKAGYEQRLRTGYETYAKQYDIAPQTYEEYAAEMRKKQPTEEEMYRLAELRKVGRTGEMYRGPAPMPRQPVPLPGIERLLLIEEAEITGKPVIITDPEDLARLDIELEEGWGIKYYPSRPETPLYDPFGKEIGVEPGEEYSYSLISPEGWEIFPDEDVYISPEGMRYTGEQLEIIADLELQREQGYALALEEWERTEYLNMVRDLELMMTLETEAGRIRRWEDEVLLPTGEWIPRKTWESLSPENQLIVREVGLQGFIKQGLERIARQQIKRDELNAIVERLYPGMTLEKLFGWAENNPEPFIQSLAYKRRTKDTETLLRLGFGASEEEIDDIFEAVEEFSKLEGVFARVFPDRDAETAIEWATKNPDDLRTTLQGIGQNPDTTVLVKMLYPKWSEMEVRVYFSPITIPEELELGKLGEEFEIGKDEAGVGVKAMLDTDWNVFLSEDGTRLGGFDIETGEFAEAPIPWWKRYLLEPALNVLGKILFPIRVIHELGVLGAVTAGEITGLVKGQQEAVEREDFWFMPPAVAERFREAIERPPELPPAERPEEELPYFAMPTNAWALLNEMWASYRESRERYMETEAPTWDTGWQMPAFLGGEELTLGVKGLTEAAFQLPVWLMIPTAIALRGALKPMAAAGGVMGKSAEVARVALAPIAGLETAVATGLRYGVGLPIKYITVDLPKDATRKAFEVALDAGLDKWLVRQGIRGNQANKVVAEFLKVNHAFLYRKAQDNLIKRMAERRGAAATAKVAAEDTVADIAPLLLDITQKEAVVAGTKGMAEPTTKALTRLGERITKGRIKVPDEATLTKLLPEGVKLEKTPALMGQLKDKGFLVEDIETMMPEKAWASLFGKLEAEVVAVKPPVTEVAPEAVPPAEPRAKIVRREPAKVNGNKFVQVEVNGEIVTVKTRGEKTGKVTNDFGDLFPIEEARAAEIKAKAIEKWQAKQVVKPPAEVAPPEVGIAEIEAELEGLREWLATEPASKLVGLIKKTGWHKGEISNLTIRQYTELTGKSPKETILTEDKKHVRWEYALDEIATEMGYANDEALRNAIQKAGKTLAQIRTLEHDLVVAREEVKPPVTTAEELQALTGYSPAAEVMPKFEAIEETFSSIVARQQLAELQKMADIWRNKIKSYDEVKKALTDFVKGFPLDVRGKMLTAVRNVKTEAGLTKAIARAETYAEQNAQKVLKAAIRKEVKATVPKKVAGIPKGKYIVEVQRRLDELRKNIDLDRNIAVDRIEKNIIDYTEGRISHEELQSRNEAMSRAGIDGMSAEELQSVLDYIRSLRTIGLSEREAARIAAKERREAVRTELIDIVTGGKGIKPEAVSLPVSEEEVANLLSRAFTKFDSFQQNWDTTLETLSKFIKAKKFESPLVKWGEPVHKAINVENDGISQYVGMLGDNAKRIFNSKNRGELNQELNRIGNTKVDLGTFTNTEGASISFKLTEGQVIAFYHKLQDPSLIDTFSVGMKWTDGMIKAVTDYVEAQPNLKAYSDWILDFYQEYYHTIAPVFEGEFFVKMPQNPLYSPSFRDLDVSTAEKIGQRLGIDESEHLRMFADGRRYASTKNASLKSRVPNTRPFRADDATDLLVNHILQMEHFKAWAEVSRELRAVINNSDFRRAVRQYHGNPWLKTLDYYLNTFIRGGMDKAKQSRVLDYFRKNFTLATLAIKPVIALKQVPSVLAYMTQMPIKDFLGGTAGFWQHPIENFKFLHEHSSHFRARVGAGFERDIRDFMAKSNIQLITGGQKFRSAFMLHIRMGDSLAVTQGMWAKFQSKLSEFGVTKETASADQIKDAIFAAELATRRTQPAFELATLSRLQGESSLWKIFTMFQNQPGQYYRIMTGAIRDIKYLRDNPTKAIATLLLTWVVLPSLFAFIADAFQFKKEHQLRAWILGPLNFALVAGPIAQSAYNWLTGSPYKHQASPMFSTFDDLYYTLQKVRKLKDEYGEIDDEAVIRVLEGAAEVTGQIVGLPTPWLVQAERGIRGAIAEGDPSRLRELAFSAWSLQPPTKNAYTEAMLDVSLLGTIKPVDEEKQKEAEERGIELADEIIGMIETNRAFRNLFGRTLPQEIIADRKAPKWIKAWAEKELSRAQSDILPNVQLYKIIDDSSIDIEHLHELWVARQEIDNQKELDVFDKRWNDSSNGIHLTWGNLTSAQLTLLKQYRDAVDKGAFLKDHPGLKLNPRNDWLKENPLDNARLAVWGQAKILSEAAYKEAQRLIKELDIPDDALPEFTLPPEGSMSTHFEYEEFVSEGKHASWEAQLLLAKDPDYIEWRDFSTPESPIAALELKVKHRSLYDQYDLLETDEERAELKADNPEWVDDMRRIDAYEAGFTDLPDVSERDLREGAKEFMRVVRTSPDYKVTLEIGGELRTFKGWGLHAIYHKYAKTEEEKVFHRQWVGKYATMALAFDTIIAGDIDLRLVEKSLGFIREDIQLDKGSLELARSKGDSKMVQFWEKVVNDLEEVENVLALAKAGGLRESHVETYVEYYEIPRKGYDDERFLMEHPEFYEACLELLGWQEKDFSKVPTEEVERLYELYNDAPEGQARLMLRHDHFELERWLVDVKGYTPLGDRWK